MDMKQAMRHAELIREAMAPNTPKTEREHALVKEIEMLLEAVEDVSDMSDQPNKWRDEVLRLLASCNVDIYEISDDPKQAIKALVEMTVKVTAEKIWSV